MNMTTSEGNVGAFLKSASEAAKLILNHVEKGHFIHITAHLDADGVAAAGIMGRALARLNTNFRIRIQHWIDEKQLGEIVADKPNLMVFIDLGSGYLDLFSKTIPAQDVVILDHHQPSGETSTPFLQVNPHLHNIDGARDISAAGIAYLVAKALDEANVDLSSIAIVGALGDLQDKYPQRALGGVNAQIVEDAVKGGYLTLEKDLVFFGRETRPIHKALAYTTTPYIPGISGEEDKSLAFLVSLGITPKHGDKWRALRDLSEEEKTKLCSALTDYLVSKGLAGNTLNLVGYVYTLTKEEPWTPLRDAREFAVLLNATGRLDKPSLGVAICMGDRSMALEEASKVLDEYRGTITKYLSWLYEKPNRIEELSNIYVVRGENFINEKVIGTLSSILSTNLPKLEKPLIAYAFSPEDNLAKFSARTLDIMTQRGLNLGQILQEAAEKFSGRGGGHDIAAGAQVPIENIEKFIMTVDEMVGKQFGKKNEG
jgi:RecJ-like exonuclease